MTPVDNRDALSIALHENDVKSFHSILTHDGLPKNDYELLMQAIDLDNQPIVNILLDNGCNVNKPGICIDTPLHMAVKKFGWDNEVEKLLNAGAQTTTVTADGNTALHEAFNSRASDRVIELLLGNLLKEAEKDIRNKDGLGFMHIACAKANKDLVKQFFELGMNNLHFQVSLSSVPYSGYTPLHFAVENGRHDVVEFLCENNANLHVQARNGKTPIQMALECGEAKMLEILSRYGRLYLHNAKCDIGSSLHVVDVYPTKDPFIIKRSEDTKERFRILFIIGLIITVTFIMCIALYYQDGSLEIRKIKLKSYWRNEVRG